MLDKRVGWVDGSIELDARGKGSAPKSNYFQGVNEDGLGCEIEEVTILNTNEDSKRLIMWKNTSSATLKIQIPEKHQFCESILLLTKLNEETIRSQKNELVISTQDLRQPTFTKNYFRLCKSRANYLGLKEVLFLLQEFK